MAKLSLFHHAQGQTARFHAFADELRSAGHTMHTPRPLSTAAPSGRSTRASHTPRRSASTRSSSTGCVPRTGCRPNSSTRAFSLGVLPAQKLAQTRAGARRALLFYSCVPTSEFGSSWAGGRTRADPRDGSRPVLRRRGRHRRRPRARRLNPDPRCLPVVGPFRDAIRLAVGHLRVRIVPGESFGDLARLLGRHLGAVRDASAQYLGAAPLKRLDYVMVCR
jgi:hypothetical protein